MKSSDILKKRIGKARKLTGEVKSFARTLKYYKPGFCPVCHHLGWGRSDICWYCGYEDCYEGLTNESFEQFRDNYRQIRKSERGIKKVKESIGNTGETVWITVILDNIVEVVKDIDDADIISYRHRVVDSKGRIVIIDDADAEFVLGEKLEVTVWSHRSNRKELWTFAERAAGKNEAEV